MKAREKPLRDFVMKNKRKTTREERGERKGSENG
jgi:hypothetical protein